MEVILSQENLTIERLEKYEVYANNIDDSATFQKNEH